MSEPRRAPYVGPKPLTADDGIYGRDWDRAQLRDLLLVRGIVLMHSPSGAGKTSLIQAGLIPLLRDKGTAVFGPVRPGVNQRVAEMPPDGRQTRYGFNILLQLDERLPDGRRSNPEALARSSMVDYFKHCRAVVSEDPERLRISVIVIDQFEEVLTLDPTDLKEKRQFFKDLGSAIRDSRFMALFSMREDYVGTLEPYLDLLPTRMETRFRLELLGRQAAMQAMQEPARKAGVRFHDSAAKMIWNSLSEVRVLESDGSTTLKSGPNVEAVQLQVVCKQIWEAEREDPLRITGDDVRKLSRVDDALGHFYSEAVKAAVEAATAKHSGKLDALERKIREWVGTRLITAQGLRGQVMAGSDAMDDLQPEAVRSLVNSFVLREEPRRGIRFYELAHDRLIGPIRRNNVEWLQSHMSALALQTKRWMESGRPDDLLLTKEEAAKAQPESERELEFVAASKRFRLQEERRSRELEGRTNLDVTGWGVIFAADADLTIRDALRPLLNLRRLQAGCSIVERYREFSGLLGYQSGESAETFLLRNGAIPGVENASAVPYYLLLVGSPKQIPFDFQYGLSAQYAVGRLDLDTPEDYSIYARSVVASESKGFGLPRRVGIFAPAHEGDTATAMTSRWSYPFAERIKALGWSVDAYIRDDATKRQLAEAFRNDSSPLLMLTIGHGVAGERETSGALVCQDWEGHGRLTREHYFTASDVPNDWRILGSILCLIATNTAGTPEMDDFSPTPRRVAETAFVASLPNRLLAHPNGGAVAGIGHIDRNWVFSLLSPDQQRSSGIFENICFRLMNGHTVGSAISVLTQRVSTLASMLVGKLTRPEETAKSPEEMLTQQTVLAMRDARNYIILGDPAARLPVTSETVLSTRPVLPALGEPAVVDIPVAPTISQDLFFNGYSVLANTYLRPPLTGSEISSVLRGISLEASRHGFIRQWYASSEALL